MAIDVDFALVLLWVDYQFRQLIKPTLNRISPKTNKGFAHQLVLLTFLLITIGVIAYFLTRSPWSFKLPSQATSLSVTRGTAGDLWADIVLGKNSFGEGEPGEVVPFKVMNPGGVVVDRSVRPNRIYIYDGANSRILGFSSLGVCQNNSSVKCTTDSDCQDSSCQIQVGGQPGAKTADIVIGQPDFNRSACNGDFNFQNYPQRAPASASSLCSMPEFQISTSEGGSFASMSVDKSGNLYVADFDNNRVLKYNSPLTTDTVADEVWGQADFSGNSCNRLSGDLGNALKFPKNNTLCLRSPFNEGFGSGTEIDKDGNLWVSDNQNQRVLRFSKNSLTGEISKTADLVLGEPDFTTNRNGADLNQMHAPMAVRINPNSGSVYVADSWNNRILVFDPPFTNGMTATRTFASGFNYPTGIDFDPGGSGIWVDDTGNNQLVEFSFDGKVQKVLFKDTYQANGKCGSTTANYDTGCLNPQTDPKTGQKVCWSNMCSVTGSVGIDSDGNVYPGGPNFMQDVWRFKAPIPSPVAGKVYSADHRFFYPPGGSNYLYSNKAFESPRSIVIAAGQLIVADAYRIMYWNIPNGIKDLTNGKAADGVAGVTNFDVADPWGFMAMTAQSDQYLWVGHMGYIDLYKLPLIMGAKPLKTAISLYNTGLPILGGGSIISQWNTGESYGDLEVSPDGLFLWATQPFLHRVLRIRNPLTQPTVDVILGQKNASGVSCNQGDPSYPAGQDSSNYPLNYLCYPGSIKFDQKGNLFVSDHWLEVNGNFRMLIFNAGTIPNSTSTPVFNLSASKAIPNVAAWKPAFDSANHMVVGYNAYHGGRFPGIYSDPLNQTAPDRYLNDYFSMPLFAAFDGSDNLFVDDLNRGRLLIYQNPLSNTTPPPPSTQLLISLTYPANGAVIKTGSKVTIKAVTKGNVKVARVEFYINNKLVCTDRSAPYTCSWTVPFSQINNKFTLFAIAYSSAGNKKTSPTIVISSGF